VPCARAQASLLLKYSIDVFRQQLRSRSNVPACTEMPQVCVSYLRSRVVFEQRGAKGKADT
jgi:hypothetical protein